MLWDYISYPPNYTLCGLISSVAQSVESVTPGEEVMGSIPSVTLAPYR